MAKANETPQGGEKKSQQNKSVDAAQAALKEGMKRGEDAAAEDKDDPKGSENKGASGSDESKEETPQGGEAKGEGETHEGPQNHNGPGVAPVFSVTPGQSLTTDEIAAAVSSHDVVMACELVLAKYNELHQRENPVTMDDLPTEEEAEKAAFAFADAPEKLAAAERIIARANAIVAERNRPAPKSAEDLEADSYQRIVNKYGKDFVTAKRNKNQKYFTRTAWNGLGKNKQGWTEVTPSVPEKQ